MAVDSISGVASPASSARKFWLWPNLLSLDAPLIAVLWQLLLAQDLGLNLNRGEPLILALCVWFVYLTDRILDVMQPAPHNKEAARKAFHREHRAIAFTMALLALPVILLLARQLLRPSTFYGGLLLALPLIVYLTVVHFSPARWRLRWPREIVIAGLFSMGTFLAVWISNGRNCAPIWAPALCFSLLCWLNCCAIETWEWQANDHVLHEQPALSTRWAAERLPWVGGGVGAGAAIAGRFGLMPAGFSAAAFLSGFALAVLALSRDRWRTDALRVMTDLALCSPLFLLRFLS